MSADALKQTRVGHTQAAALAGCHAVDQAQEGSQRGEGGGRLGLTSRPSFGATSSTSPSRSASLGFSIAANCSKQVVADFQHSNMPARAQASGAPPTVQAPRRGRCAAAAGMARRAPPHGPGPSGCTDLEQLLGGSLPNHARHEGGPHLGHSDAQLHLVQACGGGRLMCSSID